MKKYRESELQSYTTENSKNGKHRLQTNAHASGAASTNPRPPGKSLDAKAPGWGQIVGAFPGVRGGMVMAKIDSCITLSMPNCFVLTPPCQGEGG